MPTELSMEGFAARRAATWQRLSDLTSRAGRRKGLEPQEVLEFTALYRETAADLATARLRYPSLVPRLNEVVGDAFGRLYGSRRTRLRVAGRFFAFGFPRLVRALRLYVLASALLLMVPAGLFYIYGLRDPKGAATYLPKQFQSAPERGAPGPHEIDPLVSGSLSAGIFTNNIRVTFLAFAAGITFGIGTAYLLVFNGIMLGGLAGIFAAKGIYGPFWVLILPHGLLELSCIALAGACGLRLGWAMVDPGPLRRGVAMARAGREAVAVAACLAPVLVVAGLIEGYVTPSGLPGPARIGLGVLVAVGFWGWMLWAGRGRPEVVFE